jgi:NADH-quinone oxidoreductase subunit L
MLIGTLALTAFPFTSGYYSKDEILNEAWANGHHGLWAAGVFGAFLTGVYSFRLIFVTFFGPERWRTPVAHAAPVKAAAHDDHGHDDTHGAAHDDAAHDDAHAHHGLGPKDEPHGARTLDHHIPLAVLLVLATVGGFIHLPLAGVLPQPEAGEHLPALIEHAPLAVSLFGIALSWFLFLKNPQIPHALANSPATRWIERYWHSAFGFDWLYDHLLVKPFVALTRLNHKDPFDIAIMSIPVPLRAMNGWLAKTQSGQLRWYAMSVAFGAVVIIASVALS